MKVLVRLRGGLERYTESQDGCEEVTLPEGSRVSHLVGRFGFAEGQVGLIVLNGELAHPGARLSDGSRVELYPIFGGG